MRAINLIITADAKLAERLTGRSMRGTSGLTTQNGALSADIVINLRGVWKSCRMRHRDFIEELVRTVEHEYAHAVGADDEDALAQEIMEWLDGEVEAIAYKFEDLGGWARK